MSQNALCRSYDDYVTTDEQTLIVKTCRNDLPSLPCHTLFSKTYPNLLFIIGFPKACQSVLIRNIRLMTFSFITTALHHDLDKSKY